MNCLFYLHAYDVHLDVEANKRCLPHKLQGTANAFAEAAEAFNDKANAIVNGNTAGDDTNFQAAAYNFMLAGYKFKDFGKLFYEISPRFNCAKLKTKAEGITSASGADTQAISAIQAFNDAIGTFKGSASAFNEFANTISTNCPNLVAKAELFKDACDIFAADASTFNKRAQLIPSGATLGTGTHTNFKAAAEKFGKVDTAQLTTIGAGDQHGAAIAFFNAIKKLAGK